MTHSTDIGRRPIRRLLRNLVAVALMVLLFAEICGVPHLLLENDGHRCRYWSLTGTREVRGGGSLIAFISPDEPLVGRVETLWTHVTRTLKTHEHENKN